MIQRTFFNFQFLNFVGVGVSAAILHWTSRIVFNYYVDFLYAVFFSYLIAFLYAFSLNFFFVFKNKKNKFIKILKYLSVQILSFPLVILLSIILNNFFESKNLGYHAEIAHGLSISAPALLNFIIYKYLVFIDYEKK